MEMKMAVVVGGQVRLDSVPVRDFFNYKGSICFPVNELNQKVRSYPAGSMLCC